MLIHFLTRHSRPQSWVEKAGLSIGDLGQWFIIGPGMEASTTCPLHKYLVLPQTINKDFGYQVNHYLDIEPDIGQWVYILDDDNLVHPNLKRVIASLDDDCQLAVFGRQHINSSFVRIANPKNLIVGEIDAGQFIVKRSLIGDLRMWIGNVYRNDGYFLMELVFRANNQGVKIQVFKEVAAYYNAQKSTVTSAPCN